MSTDRVALLFDIDGTLIDTGGAGAASWRIAFDELYGIPADIGKFTDAGMTDPEVGRRTFVAVDRPSAFARGVLSSAGASAAPSLRHGGRLEGLPRPCRGRDSCCRD